jgi:AP endonuclease 2
MTWIKASDTQPQVKGSDHCPVYVDFHESIVDPSTGQTLFLKDVLGAPRTDGNIPDPPRIATKWWEEFSGKQTSLAQFFGRKGASNLVSSPSPSTAASAPVSQPVEAVPDTVPSAAPATLSPTSSAGATPVPSSSSTATKRKLVASQPGSQSKKSKKASVSISTKAKPGQSSIASFFAKPSASQSQGKAKEEEPEVDEDEDYKLALQLSQEPDTDLAPPSSSQVSEADVASSQKKKQAWTTLLAPTQTPLCRGHSEPAKEFTVNKPGPNKGKKFFVCSR